MYFAILGHHLHLDFIIIFLLTIVTVALRSAVLRYINILYLNTRQVFIIYIYSSHETTKLDKLRLE